ncbi:MAG: amidase family protein [Comamonadaceae bacterium]|nr:amidase family protein [Comamonadaceae bacterium]
MQRLLDAGARFVGKTHTDELAFSMNGKNAHFGTPVNGGAPERIPGGSSSGSASAVSNGLCDFALGTDTGGSVRAPASHCGLYGLRPTHGRVSLGGALDLAPSFDTCGFFARDAATFARVGRRAARRRRDAAAVGRARLLRPRDVWALLAAGGRRGAGAGAAARVEAALGAARAVPRGARFVRRRCTGASATCRGAKRGQTDGAFIERFAPPLGPGVAERFAWSQPVTDEQVADGRAVPRRVSRAPGRDCSAATACCVMPTMPDVAPLLAADRSRAGGLPQPRRSRCCRSPGWPAFRR